MTLITLPLSLRAMHEIRNLRRPLFLYLRRGFTYPVSIPIDIQLFKSCHIPNVYEVFNLEVFINIPFKIPCIEEVNVYRTWQIHITRFTPILSKKCDKFSGLIIKYLDILKGCISSIEMSLIIHRYSFGPCKPSEGVPLITKVFYIGSIWGKLLNPVIETIIHIEIPFLVNCYMSRFIKFPFFRHYPPDCLDSLACIFVYNLYAIFIPVADINPIFINSYIKRYCKLFLFTICP